MRNQAAHQEEFAISIENAKEYVSLSQSIAKQIDAISEFPKYNLHALTLLVLELNHLIDSGKYNDISISEIHQQVENGSVLRFLSERCTGDMDLSILLRTETYPNFQKYYEEILQSISNAYADSKWGIENLGLCLLLAWTNEIIQQGAGWHPSE